jgi:dephospho-CoA kinase
LFILSVLQNQERDGAMTFIVGLTGGIGSGKSTVAELFAQRGAVLVDTDAIAHQLSGPQGEAIGAIAAAFGSAVLRADGGLDRAAMRRLVFADPTAKATLEAILHPLIRQRSDACCAASSSP